MARDLLHSKRHPCIERGYGGSQRHGAIFGRNRILTPGAAGAAALTAITGAVVSAGGARRRQGDRPRRGGPVAHARGRRSTARSCSSASRAASRWWPPSRGLTPGTHGFPRARGRRLLRARRHLRQGPFQPLERPARRARRRGQASREGDLGNIEADASGKAQAKLMDAKLSFDGAQSIRRQGGHRPREGRRLHDPADRERRRARGLRCREGGAEGALARTPCGLR